MPEWTPPPPGGNTSNASGPPAPTGPPHSSVGTSGNVGGWPSSKGGIGAGASGGTLPPGTVLSPPNMTGGIVNWIDLANGGTVIRYGNGTTWYIGPAGGPAQNISGSVGDWITGNGPPPSSRGNKAGGGIRPGAGGNTGMGGTGPDPTKPPKDTIGDIIGAIPRITPWGIATYLYAGGGAPHAGAPEPWTLPPPYPHGSPRPGHPHDWTPLPPGFVGPPGPGQYLLPPRPSPPVVPPRPDSGGFNVGPPGIKPPQGSIGGAIGGQSGPNPYDNLPPGAPPAAYNPYDGLVGMGTPPGVKPPPGDPRIPWRHARPGWWIRLAADGSADGGDLGHGVG
jgi:hypothetical protein